MVDAPEAWEFPKPGTEDEIAAKMAAEPPEDRPGSSEQNPSISGDDKATLADRISHTDCQSCTIRHPGHSLCLGYIVSVHRSLALGELRLDA